MRETVVTLEFLNADFIIVNSEKPENLQQALYQF